MKRFTGHSKDLPAGDYLILHFGQAQEVLASPQALYVPTPATMRQHLVLIDILALRSAPTDVSKRAKWRGKYYPRQALRAVPLNCSMEQPALSTSLSALRIHRAPGFIGQYLAWLRELLEWQQGFASRASASIGSIRGLSGDSVAHSSHLRRK
jgi:hypothetical protein